ncbi:restriction endonuclease subunit S [Escherichia coli]|uniref:restriction endonuclease subunit S n=5 Tax=Escherichia coli TaxID=562 RepID=UPI0005A988DB|nr:restriction endonuclease subunit S [Escherichia coli]MCN4945306.1 restriction endonuclease subunit S [Escherichia coli]MCN6292750.1 restriction endonuclease subunit S [Escherichia coli]MCO0994660.1 restriction endonuclease subunit S [Escherichia coli]MCV1038364.1 restriction endonuclease subunit S [Escherichia coli]MCV1097585.1 restriction endonuclease subunit S [Escherichia coli]
MKSEEKGTKTQMVIPDGYKLTELGEIPEDWQCVQLGEIGKCIIGLTYSPRNVSDTGVLVLRSSNIQNGKLAYQDNVFVNMVLPERVIVKKGDILICVRNGSRQLIGKCALIDQKAEGSAFGAFMSIFRTSAHDYIFYQFQSDLIQNQINETMGATINQITNKDLSGFKIPIPICVKEQKAIANVLSDTDALLTRLEQLIAKKQAIKTATMQQLLTGRTRLPQFAKHSDGTLKGHRPSELGAIPEDWQVVPFKDVLTIKHGKNQKEVESPSGQYPIYATGGQIGNATSFLFDKPSVLIGRKGTIDKPRYAETPFWTVDTLFYSEIKKDFCVKFIYYKFCMIDWMQYNEASGVPSLNAHTIENVLATLPNLEEQTAIASILSDMDDELEALEQKLAKVRNIKQGMMQQLLTGRIRLPLEQQP